MGVGWRRRRTIGGGWVQREARGSMFGLSLSCRMKVKCPSFSLLRCRVGLRIGVKRRVWREKGVNKMPCDAISKASVRLVGAGVALEGHEGRSDAKATRGQV